MSKIVGKRVRAPWNNAYARVIGDYILPESELDRRLRTTHACAKCGGRRYFESRLRDDGLCGGCARLTAAPEDSIRNDLRELSIRERHVASIDNDRDSLQRGGSTRVAICTCGWRGPERATLELVCDDALEHERLAKAGSDSRSDERDG